MNVTFLAKLMISLYWKLYKLLTCFFLLIIYHQKKDNCNGIKDNPQSSDNV